MMASQQRAGIWEATSKLLSFFSPSNILGSLVGRKRGRDADVEAGPVKSKQKVVGGSVFYKQPGATAGAQITEPAKISKIEDEFGSKRFTLVLLDGRDVNVSEDEIHSHPSEWTPPGDRENKTEEMCSLVTGGLSAVPGDARAWGRAVGLLSSRAALLPPAAAPLVAARLAAAKVPGDDRVRGLALKALAFAIGRDPQGALGFLPAFLTAGGEGALAALAAEGGEDGPDGDFLNFLAGLLAEPETKNATVRALVGRLRAAAFPPAAAASGAAPPPPPLPALLRASRRALAAEARPAGRDKVVLDFWRSTVKKASSETQNCLMKSGLHELLAENIVNILRGKTGAKGKMESPQASWKKLYIIHTAEVWTAIAASNQVVRQCLFDEIAGKSGIIQDLISLYNNGEGSKDKIFVACILLGMESCNSEKVRKTFEQAREDESLELGKSLQVMKERFPKLTINRTSMLKTHVSKRKTQKNENTLTKQPN